MMRAWVCAGAAAAVSLLMVGADADEAGEATCEARWVQLLVDDMEKPHEGRPSGVPSGFGWAEEPRVGMGNSPGDWNAMTMWGQIYLEADAEPPAEPRVEVRNPRAYKLSKASGEWRVLQASETVEGAAYVEDYEDDASMPADTAPGVDGGVSVRLEPGHNYHFWPPDPPGRVTIDPGDVGGMAVVFEARLAPGYAPPEDGAETSRILASAGGDYWESLDAQWDHFNTNSDFAIGRFRFVTGEWSFFTAHTLSEDELRANPPPMPEGFRK